MSDELCRDPRRIGCRHRVQNYRHKVCLRCYQWLRDHKRIKMRSYIPKVPPPPPESLEVPLVAETVTPQAAGGLGNVA
jgi:hypothetical protein